MGTRSASAIGITGALLALLLPVTAGGGVHRYVEDFTTQTYCDTDLTTARWDTVAGEIGLFPFGFPEVGTLAGVAPLADLAIAGDHLYGVNENGELVAVDISDPANPELVAEAGIGGESFGVAISGNYAFVSGVYSAVEPAGLGIIDVTDPANPLPTGVCEFSGDPGGVAVDGDHAFVAAGGAGLHVIDVSAPSDPSPVGYVDTPGMARDVVVTGNLAYVADDLAGLQIVDVSDPSAPFLLGACDTPGQAGGVAVDGDHVYVADGSAGLTVIDVSDPTNPVPVGSLDTPGDAAGVALAGRRVYLASGSSGLQIIDVGEPENPSQVGSRNTAGEALGVAVAGEHAFVADGAAGLAVVDISDNIPPVVIGEWGTEDPYGHRGDMVVADGRAYIIGTNLDVVDLTDPMHPALLGTVDVPGFGIALAGDHAYVATSWPWVGYDLAVIDISDPADPQIVVDGGSSQPYGGIDVAGDRAYIAALDEGVLVFDITDPTSPALVGSCAVAYAAIDIAVDGDYAYVADGNAGLSVIDVSDAAAPTVVATHDTPGSAAELAVAGNRVYVADGSAGLVVFDVTVPQNPSILGTCDVGYSVGSVAVDGDIAYVLEHNPSSSALYVVDISDPANPFVLAGTDHLPVEGTALALGGDCAYTVGFPLNAYADPAFHVVWVRQGDVMTEGNDGRSLNLEPSDYEAAFARITTAQADSIRWELSPDGAAWTEISPTGTWHEFPSPGPALFWRSHHTFFPEGDNPACTDLEIEWVRTAPWIESIADVPGDQGRQVSLVWTKCGCDYVGSANPIVQYAIYRRIDDLPGSARRGLEIAAAGDGNSREATAADGETPGIADGPEAPTLWPPGDWHFVTTVPAADDAEYAAVVPTLADSTTENGVHHSTFFIRAMTAVPTVYFDSPPDSGCSVDNLAPEPPSGFAVEYEANENQLSWEESGDEDFDRFRVYRSTDPEFVPGPEHLVHTTTALDWVDEVEHGWQYVYRITATDFAGNESDPAAPEAVTELPESPEPVRFALHQNAPNPLVDGTVIRYDLPAPGADVTLVIFDVAGRRVRMLVSGWEAGGRREVAWDRRDERGAPVASGVYYCRLLAPGFEGTRKMIVVK